MAVMTTQQKENMLFEENALKDVRNGNGAAEVNG
jgi:hypothetical protein